MGSSSHHVTVGLWIGSSTHREACYRDHLQQVLPGDLPGHHSGGALHHIDSLHSNSAGIIVATFIVAFFIRTNISVAFFDMAFNIMALVASLLYIRLDLVSSSSNRYSSILFHHEFSLLLPGHYKASFSPKLDHCRLLVEHSWPASTVENSPSPTGKFLVSSQPS